MLKNADKALKKAVLLGGLVWFSLIFVVEASEIKFNGEVKIKYKWMNYGNIIPPEYTCKTIFLHNGSWNMGKNTELFWRFAGQQIGGDAERITEARADKYGMRIKQGNAGVTLGTKSMYIGAFGGLVDLSDNLIDGLFTGADLTVGEKNSYIRLQTGQLEKSLFSDSRSREITALHVGEKWGKTGLEVTMVNIPGLYVAERFFDFSIKHGANKVTYLAEFIQSSGPEDNSAFFAGINYKPDKENTIALLGGRTGKTAIPGGPKSIGAHDNGIKGYQLKIFRNIGQGQISVTLAKARSFVYNMNVTKTELAYKLKF